MFVKVCNNRVIKHIINMDYGKAIEPLISKMVAISYKTLTNIPLSESDKRHREYIIECTRMYDNMVKNDTVMHDNKIEEKISKDEDKKEVYNIKADLRTKLKLYTLVDKGAYLNYIRNVDQKKYQRGAHNSKNRKRF